jgi:hypothetical protein
LTTIDYVQLIEDQKVSDSIGNLSVVDEDTIPFEIKRVYYLYAVPSGNERGRHSYIDQLRVFL